MNSTTTFQFLALFGIAAIELVFFPFIRSSVLLPSFVFPIAFINLIHKKYHFVFALLIAKFSSEYLLGNRFSTESFCFCFFLFASEMIFLRMRHFGFRNYWQKFGILYFFLHLLEYVCYGSYDFISCGIEVFETILVFPLMYRLFRTQTQKVDLHVHR